MVFRSTSVKEVGIERTPRYSPDWLCRDEKKLGCAEQFPWPRRELLLDWSREGGERKSIAGLERLEAAREEGDGNRRGDGKKEQRRKNESLLPGRWVRVSDSLHAGFGRRWKRRRDKRPGRNFQKI